MFIWKSYQEDSPGKELSIVVLMKFLLNFACDLNDSVTQDEKPRIKEVFEKTADSTLSELNDSQLSNLNDSVTQDEKSRIEEVFEKIVDSARSELNDSQLSNHNNSVTQDEKSRNEEVFEKIADKWQGTDGKRRGFVRCNMMY